MPLKRKASSQTPQEDSHTSRPYKKQQKSSSSFNQFQQTVPIVSTSAHADFGSAFASLFEAPTPIQVDSTVSTTAKPIPTKSIPQDSKASRSKNDDKFGKKGKFQKEEPTKPAKLTMKDKRAAKAQSNTPIASTFAEAKQQLLKKQSSSNVITASRASEGDRLAEKLALMSHQKQKEKKMLLEKDHVRPQYNETEKQLVRVATKGVVTLFQAVWEQTQKIKELHRATHLASGTKDKIISEESQAGFLDLLKQASDKNSFTEPVFVPSNRKKFSDLKSKLENDEEIDQSDLRGIGLSDDSDSGYDQEEAVPKFKQRLTKQPTPPTAPKPSNKQQASAATWSVLDDDYLQGKNPGKMKDWEKDNTSDSSDL